MGDKYKILFVCLGNICRSPAADGIMRDLISRQGLENEIEVDSAGTYGGHAGELPDSRMRAAAAKRGIELDHRSRQIVHDDLERFDMVLTMDDSNYDNVCRMARSPEEVGKVSRMTDYSRKFEINYVPDPYYAGREGFEYVLDILEDACANLLDKVCEKLREGARY